MADIASAKQKINDVEVNADAPLSEALHEKIGGSINYLIDTTDDHETRLDSLETETTGVGSVSASTTTSTGALLSASITPDGTNVLVFPSGNITTLTGADSATVQLRRGATVLASFDVSGAGSAISHGNQQNLGVLSFLDTGATSAGSNSYSIHISTITGTVTFSNLVLRLVDVK